ncbi:Uma2 family endonuclease [Spirosoma montaniterrae]|nr:Uma2 family endonuclease [Spirosoma montaniterrae]
METLLTPPPKPVQALDVDDIAPVSFRVRQIMTSEEFYTFCQDNPTYKFERDPDGRIFVMPNTGGKTGIRNSKLNLRVGIWNEQTNAGEVFDSSTAFDLPDGSTRSPDVAWVSRERWDALTEQQQEKFPPVCPDFVIELLRADVRSPSDSLSVTKKKMTDVWIKNGCRLAWLIDPKSQTTHIFRANGEIQIIEGFDKSLSGETVLPGFTLTL